MKDAASLARKRAAPAISCGCPQRSRSLMRKSLRGKILPSLSALPPGLYDPWEKIAGAAGGGGWDWGFPKRRPSGNQVRCRNKLAEVRAVHMA